MAEAETWYLAAAEQEHNAAQLALRIMYQSGEFGERKFELAVAWHRRAAAQGLVGTQTYLP
jgi:TPR repeat protein